MKRVIVLTALLIVSLMTGCVKDDTSAIALAPSQVPTSESTSEESTTKESLTDQTSTEETISTQEESSQETSEETTSAASAPVDTTIVDTALDPNLYNTKENPVPFGQWVYISEKNYQSDVYEPIYIRIVSVSRDKAEIDAVLASYDGIMDFTLTEDQARDIEYGLVKYELHFAHDYTQDEYGIYVPTISIGATPIETVGFQTDGGMSYIGVGRTYPVVEPEEDILPGDVVEYQSVFTILNNYDETEYLLDIGWYDGEIVEEKARRLYLGITE